MNSQICVPLHEHDGTFFLASLHNQLCPFPSLHQGPPSLRGAMVLVVIMQ